jgi:hypothetical protein
MANWKMAAKWKGLDQMEGETTWKVVAKWKVRPIEVDGQVECLSQED